MRKNVKKFIILLLAAGVVGTSFSPAISYNVYATEESVGAYIQASDLTFTSSETGKKKIDFKLTGVDERNLAISYPSTGIVSINALGEVTPLDIGEVEVTLYDITNTNISATITISVWKDRLPAAPNINITTSVTSESVTVINNSTDIPEGAYFMYSDNNVIWQDSTEFKGLTPETEYTIYARVIYPMNNKKYDLFRDEVAKVKTDKKEESEDDKYKEYTLGSLNYKEGTIYELNLDSFKDKNYEIISEVAGRSECVGFFGYPGRSIQTP